MIREDGVDVRGGGAYRSSANEPVERGGAYAAVPATTDMSAWDADRMDRSREALSRDMKGECYTDEHALHAHAHMLHAHTRTLHAHTHTHTHTCCTHTGCTHTHARYTHTRTRYTHTLHMQRSDTHEVT